GGGRPDPRWADGRRAGIRPFGHLTSMVVTIGLWLTLARHVSPRLSLGPDDLGLVLGADPGEDRGRGDQVAEPIPRVVNVGAGSHLPGRQAEGRRRPSPPRPGWPRCLAGL